jgi:carboxymethylenebutenolidase
MKQLFALLPAVAFAATSALAQDWARARLDKSPRHLEWVTVKHDSREVGCYVGYPEVKDKATAVIVIHEIYGLSDWARSVVDEFAEAGYIAIAPDLLWGQGAKGGGSSELSSKEIGEKIRALPDEQITADLNAVADYVAKLPSCNGKIVVIGFCWGGGQSWAYATKKKKNKSPFGL